LIQEKLSKDCCKGI